MHSQATRNEFLRLRIQGLSLAGIGRRLGLSKPTVIKWNRQLQTQIAACASHLPSPISNLPEEVADLTRRLAALKQELFSRALREFPTAALETLAGQYRQRLETLQGIPPPSSVRTDSTPSLTFPEPPTSE